MKNATCKQSIVRGKSFLDFWFVLFIILIFGIATIPQLTVGDYPTHLSHAQYLAEEGHLQLLHPLLQQLVVITRAILPFSLFFGRRESIQILIDHSYLISSFFVALACYISTAFLLRKQFMKVWNDKFGSKTRLFANLASIASLLVSPIIIFTLRDRLILGYISPNVLHNPTYILMRVFVVWIFFFIIDHLHTKLTQREWWTLFIVTGLATLAKPSYGLSLFPAFYLYNLIISRDLKKWNWSLLTALTIPFLLVNVYQLLIVSGIDTVHFVIAPFQAALFYTKSFFLLLLFLLLSVLFPIVFIILNRKNLYPLKNAIVFSWINFAVGLSVFIIFNESTYPSALDFIWTPMMASFLLFTTHLMALGNLEPESMGSVKSALPKKYIPLSIYGFHLLSGIVYLIETVIHPGPVR